MFLVGEEIFEFVHRGKVKFKIIFAHLKKFENFFIFCRNIFHPCIVVGQREETCSVRRKPQRKINCGCRLTSQCPIGPDMECEMQAARALASGLNAFSLKSAVVDSLPPSCPLGGLITFLPMQHFPAQRVWFHSAYRRYYSSQDSLLAS
jgi:hypothetical protein